MDLLEPVIAARIAAGATTLFPAAVATIREAEAMTPEAAVAFLERRLQQIGTGGHLIRGAYREAAAHTQAGLDALAFEISEIEREADYLASGKSIDWMIRNHAEAAEDMRLRAASMRQALTRREAAVARPAVAA